MKSPSPSCVEEEFFHFKIKWTFELDDIRSLCVSSTKMEIFMLHTVFDLYDRDLKIKKIANL